MSSLAAPAVEVVSLTRRYGEATALDAISFTVAPGQIFGFVGPDGAGKTTLFRILTTLLLPDSGAARVLGLDVVRDIWALRSRVGYMPGRFSLYPDLSVAENLDFFASVFGTSVSEQYEWIRPIYGQIESFSDRRAGALSGGMKQKLALSCALVHRPDILFLDEPTTGVDAVSRREFWDLLALLGGEGLTIVVSTPYMDEANRCDRVALIQDGRILDIDSPRAITSAYPFPLFSIRATDRNRALLALRRFPRGASVFAFGSEIHYSDGRADLHPSLIGRELQDYLTHEGLGEVEISPIAATIEDSFMALMASSAATGS